MRQKFLGLALIFALALGGSAQQRPDDQSAPSVDRLREHVSYLASDKLEGRRTGSAGATIAAEYIAREFARAGLRRSIGHDLPGMSILEADSPRRYMQEFPFVAGVELGQGNALTLKMNADGKTVSLRAGEDWMPLGFSSNAKLADLPAAFVHYGIKADELNYDDYANTPVKGRVAVALSGSPDGDNPHGQFARYEDVRWKAIAARNAGAAALVVIAAADNFKDDRLARLSYDQSAGEAGLPVVVISRQVALRLFQLKGPAQFAEFETKLGEFTKASRVAGAPTEQYDVKLTIKPPFDFTIALSTEIVRRSAPAYNVVGILEGSDPQLKTEAIVIGAHYDHLGRGGAGSLAPREGEIHHGADDNASGVAGVLELARIFAAERAKMKRTLVFVAFGGEEEGLLGSNYYVNHPIWPLDKTVAMVNMDMIGRMKEGRLMIGGTGTAAEWKEWIQAENTAADKFTLSLNEDGYGPSDHSSFYAKQVPVLFFFTGTHDDYHKPTDTAEKIAYDDEARVIRFVASLVRTIDARQQRPTYAVAKSQPQGRSMGFRVYLGTIPNYAESNDGMTLDGVRDESPAAAAGLKAGDKIVKMAGREVKNVYDYTYALGEMKAGQEYEVEVVRGGERLKLKITPLARK